MKRTKNPAKEAEYRKRAADLVAQMTLHEKVSQMLSWAPAIERLGIPAYNWWSEGIHGVGRAGTATVFPQAIGMAAAFDEDMMEQVGNAIGVEARGKYNMCRAHGDRDIFKGLTVWAPQHQHLPRSPLGPWPRNLRRGSVPDEPPRRPLC